jgi:predicted ArsR family transcriptional regulator
VTALVDPVRRALYEYVRRQRRAVTREEAAQAQAISRSLTAFHLDKLVDSGLLRARYESPAGQPRGRGRAPKVYESVDEGLLLAVPPRRYELVGQILADAVATAPTAAGEAALRVAFDLGQALTAQKETRPGAEDLASVRTALAEIGFEPTEPTAEPERIIMLNCPFHALASRQRELICGINRAFVSGMLAGLGTERLTATLAPRPGNCCVEVGVAAHCAGR